MEPFIITTLLIPVPCWSELPTNGKTVALIRDAGGGLIFTTSKFFARDCTVTSDGLFYRYVLPTPWSVDDVSIYDLISTCLQTDSVVRRTIPFVYSPLISAKNIFSSRQMSGERPSTNGRITLYPLEFSPHDYYFHASFEYTRQLPNTSVMSVGDVSINGISSILKMFNDMNQFAYIDIYPIGTNSIDCMQPVSLTSSNIITIPLPTSSLYVNVATTSSFSISIDPYGLYETSYIIPNNPIIGVYRFTADYDISFHRPEVDPVYLQLETSMLDKAYEVIPGTLAYHNKIEYNPVFFETAVMTYKYKSVIALKYASYDIGYSIRFRLVSRLSVNVAGTSHLLTLSVSQSTPIHMRITSIPGNWIH